MSASSDQVANIVGKQAGSFAVMAVQAVSVVCNGCGQRATFPVSLCPDYAARWTEQHSTAFHAPGSARPAKIGPHRKVGADA